MNLPVLINQLTLLSQLVSISCLEDILPKYRGTPIGLLFEYPNLGRPFSTYSPAQLLIGTCVYYRENLHIPDKFAYTLRTAGANLRYSEFQISLVQFQPLL